MNSGYYFKEPAACFEEAFPLGNGSLGAMLYGGTEEEKLSLNTDTLWTGHPRAPEAPVGAVETYKKAQALMLEGRINEAESLMEDRFNTRDCQMYEPLGTLRLNFGHRNAADYTRSLDLSRGVASVFYSNDGVSYSRTAFVSHPHNALVLHLAADRKEALSFTLDFSTPQTVLHSDTYAGCFRLTGATFADGKGLKPEESPGDAVRFTVAVRPLVKGGALAFTETGFAVEYADEVTVLFCCFTSYIDPYQKPLGEHERKALDHILSLPVYETLLADHTADFESLMSRTEIALESDPGTAAKYEKTDIRSRLKTFDGSDLGLYALYFRFARYLTVSASRKGSLAMNLQGIWNERLTPPWNSNYTVNINTEMNYWPTFPAGLAECFEPFARLVTSLVPSGRETARAYFGARGFVCCHNTDPWAHTVPASPGRRGSAVWSPWYLASGWLALQLFDGYAYTLDKDYLASVYPIMREAARFYLDILIPDGEKLILTPTASPENRYLLSGYACAFARSTTMAQSIVCELFETAAKAGEILETDPAFTEKLRETAGKLAPYHIGKDGRLLEWDDDYAETEPEHRHVSHLFSLYPGHNLSPEKTPALAEACRKTLSARGDDGTGWSLGWKICFYTALRDGDHALKLLDRQLRLVDPSQPNNGHGGTYPNLFDAHPPVQIDGNFGAAAGIAQMLVAGEIGTLRLLPALPKTWKNGRASGLVARGDVTVDLTWRDGALTAATLSTRHPQTLTVVIPGKTLSVTLPADTPVSLPL